ncbi:MAG: ABC transporter permease, partial [Patescibacteria group bacterium]|nr:ABC transporter permease [Patescibacteria group bacterium]
MKVQDLFEETYFALLANKARTGLTVLGIVIGIGSVIAMISLGQGATGSIESSIQSIGSNLIIVMPSFQRGVGTQVSAGRGSAQTLKPADAEAIQEQITLVKAVAPELSGRYQITTKGKNTNTSVIGTTAAYSSVRNVEVDIGSFISDQNVQGSSKVAVIGPTVRDDRFGENVNPVGQTIRIKKIEFKVIGLTKT